ncbi:MAG: hypothetical protein NVSMB19_10610 [Vulcanimicrobiaceae bacterium]
MTSQVPSTLPQRVHLVTGLLERAGALLLVASRYPNRADVLWNLPGGRQRDGELLGDALAREFREETSLAIARGPLAYVAESYDRATGIHFANFAFHVTAEGEPRVPPGDAHAVDAAWVARADLAATLAIAVVREPLLAYLRGDRSRYTAFDDAGVTIEFADPA